MTWAAIGIGTAAAGTAVVGGIMGSNAAKKAANAQQEAADQWRTFVANQEKEAVGLMGSPEQMAAYDQALKAQQQVVRQQQTLAQSINPNLVEVGKQLSGLLQGKSAPVLNNIQNQRNLQRQQLIDQINTQMGPGGQSSSAGTQALNQFDQQTANMMSQAQNQYVGEFLQTSLSAPSVMNALGGSNTELAQIMNMSPDAQKARLMAAFAGANGQAQAAQMQAAGGQAASGMIMGNMVQGLGQAGLAGAAALAGKNQVNPGGGGNGIDTSQLNGSQNLQMPQLGSQFSGPGYGLGVGSASPSAMVASRGAGTLGADVNPTSVNYAQVPMYLDRNYGGFQSPDGMALNLPWSGAAVRGYVNQGAPTFAGNQ